MEAKEWTALQTYLRHHHVDRTIGQVKSMFPGLTYEEYKEAYDSIFKPDGGLYPIKDFPPIEDDGLPKAKTSYGYWLPRKEEIGECTKRQIFEDNEKGLSPAEIGWRHCMKEPAVVELLKRYGKKRNAPIFISPAQQQIEEKLQSGEWVRTTDIYGDTGASQQAVSRMLNRMLRSGLVERMERSRAIYWRRKKVEE